MAAQQPEAPAAGELPAGWEDASRLSGALAEVGKHLEAALAVPLEDREHLCDSARALVRLWLRGPILRSVELASAARAARLRAASMEAIGLLQQGHPNKAAIRLQMALDTAAQPSDPWAALMALLAEIAAEAPGRIDGNTRNDGWRAACQWIDGRLRAALGLPEPSSG